MRRNPAVAGHFYPLDEIQLEKEVADYLPAVEPREALAVISPHAGYVYSGSIAGQTLGSVRIPSRVVILGPNHHGHGHPAAVFSSGSWLTPLGETAIDGELAERILAACPAMAADTLAHRFEHSLEVQLPFIQALSPRTSIVPICLSQLPLEQLLAMGEGLAKAIASCPEEVLIVTSSDMTHYESGEAARQKDMLALDQVVALDPAGLYRTVREQGITMCGVIPAVVMLAAVRRLGADRATLVRYGNSGDVTGDQSEVVGYAGVIIERGTALAK